jgi:hypothetical protein
MPLHYVEFSDLFLVLVKYKWVRDLVSTTEQEVAQWVGGCSLKSRKGKTPKP